MFNPELAASLPGPDWLTARRQAAAERAAAIPLPSADEEVWRYSRIAELDLAAFSPIGTAAPAPHVPAGAAAARASLGELAGVVVVVDGRIVEAELATDVAAAGVTFGPLVDTPGAEEALGALTGSGADAFVVLNDGFTVDPVGLHVPRGVTVDQPFAVIDWLTVDGAATFPRLVVRVGENADVRLVEWQGGDDVGALVAPVTELAVEPAGRLHHALVQDRGPCVWQISTVTVEAGRDATYAGWQAGLGGDYARVRTDCRLTGRGATGNLEAVYFGERNQMLDFRTFQDHRAPDTTSNLLFKGAVGGHSRSVYTGLIKVEKGAHGTNAFQTNRNLKLSDGAWAESVPNLEIETNDVRCSHASTVGPIDPEQRFYLESRGVPTLVAERLVVAGFFEEVLSRSPVPAVADVARAAVRARLDRGVEV